MWVMSMDMWAALQWAGMSTLEGVHTRIQGKAATTSQRLVPWVPLPDLAASPEEPRTRVPTEASKAYGQLPSLQPRAVGSSPHTRLPCAVHVSFVCPFPQAAGMGSFFFFLSKATDLKKKSSKGQLQNQLNLEAIFHWKIPKDLNSSAFQIKNNKWCQFFKKKMSSTLYSMKLFIKGKALYRCEEFFSSRDTAHPTSAGEGLTSKRGKRGREENPRWWSWEFIQDENFFKEEKSAPPTTSLCSWTALTFKALEVKF